MVGKIMKKRVFAIGMLLSIMTMATLISKIYALDLVLTIDVNNPDGGTTNPIPDDYHFDHYGANITVTAINNSGYWFVGWEFDGQMQNWSNPVNLDIGFAFYMQPHGYLIAVFEVDGQEYANWTLIRSNADWAFNVSFNISEV